VAQQARALVGVAVLGRLALRMEAALAHEAGAARDVERDHDGVAGRDLLDLGADLFDDAHRLVADDVALLHDGAELRVEVQVGSSMRGSGASSTRTSSLPCQTTAFM